MNDHITTQDFPQADRLTQVGEVALAVAKSKHTDDEIEEHIGLGSQGRQGRYYRLAAVTLGLIRNTDNHALLTPLGMEYASLSTSKARLDFLARCLIETKVFKAGLKYIKHYKPNEEQLKLWFINLYPGEVSTAKRRFSTFKHYIKDANLIKYDGGIIQIRKYSGAVGKISAKGIPSTLMRKRVPATVPVTGKVTRAKVVAKVSSGPPSVYTKIKKSYEFDPVKIERANHIHWELIAAKSEYLQNMGFDSYENELIDLFVNDENPMMYEMKSINPDSTNFVAQARKAIAQLYEYRYIFNIPHANLCIVTNAQIPPERDWFDNYLTHDRQIAYEWTEDLSNFNALAASQELLGKYYNFPHSYPVLNIICRYELLFESPCVRFSKASSS